MTAAWRPRKAVGYRAISLLVSLGLAALVPATAGASHLRDEGVLRTRWVRHGFSEGRALASADLDGDGTSELIYGGRGIAALDGESLETRRPRWSVKWNHLPEDNVLDGGDNSWTTGLETADATGDGIPDVYAASSDSDAYLIDGATGEKLWHNPLTGTWLSFGIALINADDDAVPDLFPTGGTAAISGATGEELWDTELPDEARRVAAAELDGEPGRDVIVAIGGGLQVPNVYGFSSSGQKLFEWRAGVGVDSVAAADLDGDGIDEAVVGTFNGPVYAVGADGLPRWVSPPGGVATAMSAADADGDGLDEVFVGFTSNLGDDRPPEVVALGPGGVPVWRHVVGHEVTSVVPAQLDGDEPLELVVGGGTYIGLDNSGVALALETGIVAPLRERWRVETHNAVLDSETVTRDGRRVTVLSGADGLLRGVDAATGEAAWTFATGGYVFATDSGDVDGDQVDEIAAGDDEGVVTLSDAGGAELWSHRADVTNDGQISGVEVADLDGDGAGEVTVTAQRFDDDDNGGAVEVLESDGSLRWSSRLPGWAEDVDVADLDGDGTGEVIASESNGLDGPCFVSAFDGASGARLWRTQVSNCLIPVIDAADVNGDDSIEVAYGTRTLFSQPHAAVLEGDGSIAWVLGIAEQVFWVEGFLGGMVHGGFGFSSRGNVTRRTADGQVVWSSIFEDDEDYGSGSRFGIRVPDQTGDGVFEVAASGDEGAVHLLDGASGSELWVTRLEPADLEFVQRHQAGPLVYVPPQLGRDPVLIAAQHGTHRKRAQIFALSLDGGVLGSTPTEGEAHAAVPVRFPGGLVGAVVGAGLGLYAIDACPGCN